MGCKSLLLFVFGTWFVQVNAQLNVNLAYNNKSILYEGAQGLHGMSFMVLHKTKTNALNGFELCFNQGKGFRDFPVLLAKKPSEKNYGKVPYTDQFQTKDTGLDYKQFQGKRAYVYFSFSIQHFKPLKSKSKHPHYLGFNAGFNLLASRILVRNENVNGKYFDNRASSFQLMLGVAYQREIKLEPSMSFFYGANVSLSAMLLPIVDFDSIDGPILTGSIYGGVRLYVGH